MSDRFTDSVEPFALATQGRTIEGKIPLAELRRLSASVRSSSGLEQSSDDETSSEEAMGAGGSTSSEMEGDVEFSLLFGLDEVGAPRIGGNVSTKLRLQCQRCMEAMDYPLTLKIRLGIVPTREAAANLPDSYDPLVVSGDEISIASILEDELILAMPIVAIHEIENCSQGEAFSAVRKNKESENLDQEAEQDSRLTSKRENLFAVLAQLKKDQL